MESRIQHYSNVPLNSRVKALLFGLVYCGHCGSKLILTTSGDNRDRKNCRIRLRYNCHHKIRHPQECDGQSGYGVPKLDSLIDCMMILLFSQLKDIPARTNRHEAGLAGAGRARQHSGTGAKTAGLPKRRNGPVIRPRFTKVPPERNDLMPSF